MKLMLNLEALKNKRTKIIVINLKTRTMKTNNNSKESFLTVEQAFDYALENLKGKSSDAEKSKVYVWRQRYREGKLSHKKISDILSEAGFAKAVEERWISLEEKSPKIKENIVVEEAFKD